MKIIKNNIIPFKGFKCINLFGILFVRNNAFITDVDINHEAIHTAQMKELFYIGFYLIYAIEWLWKSLFYEDAYRNVSFEKEAYTHQEDLNYLEWERKHYAMWK